jgi:hypothetical protein
MDGLGSLLESVRRVHVELDSSMCPVDDTTQLGYLVVFDVGNVAI